MNKKLQLLALVMILVGLGAGEYFASLPRPLADLRSDVSERSLDSLSEQLDKEIDLLTQVVAKKGIVDDSRAHVQYWTKVTEGYDYLKSLNLGFRYLYLYGQIELWRGKNSAELQQNFNAWLAAERKRELAHQGIHVQKWQGMLSEIESSFKKLFLQNSSKQKDEQIAGQLGILRTKVHHLVQQVRSELANSQEQASAATTRVERHWFVPSFIGFGALLLLVSFFLPREKSAPSLAASPVPAENSGAQVKQLVDADSLFKQSLEAQEHVLRAACIVPQKVKTQLRKFSLAVPEKTLQHSLSQFVAGSIGLIDLIPMKSQVGLIPLVSEENNRISFTLEFVGVQAEDSSLERNILLLSEESAPYIFGKIEQSLSDYAPVISISTAEHKTYFNLQLSLN